MKVYFVILEKYSIFLTCYLSTIITWNELPAQTLLPVLRSWWRHTEVGREAKFITSPRWGQGDPDHSPPHPFPPSLLLGVTWSVISLLILFSFQVRLRSVYNLNLCWKEITFSLVCWLPGEQEEKDARQKSPQHSALRSLAKCLKLICPQVAGRGNCGECVM